MNHSDARIARDLCRKIGDQLQSSLQREMDLARVVIDDPAVLVFMLVELASGVSSGAALYAMQVRTAGTEPGDMFDLVRRQIDVMVDLKKQPALSALAEFEQRKVRAS